MKEFQDVGKDFPNSLKPLFRNFFRFDYVYE